MFYLIIVEWSGLPIKYIASAESATPTTLTTPSAPVGIDSDMPPKVSLAYKHFPTFQFQASILTIEPGKATFIA